MHLVVLGLVSVDPEQHLAISSDKDINAQDSLGRTPLHWASALREEMSLLLSRSLLDANASTTIRDSRNQMPIHHCAMTGNAEVMKLLIVAAALRTGTTKTWRPRVL
ncbi:uncharacterized protein LY89DRAFT_765531 [Mollisia scopiformis]|uniref:Uncharacterized protein n=1 Tax=Mollisia scopiformis TaxID=149040 RepID=A0A132B6N1_MOLSC|nr:uncharacterized protein LY89DRAFT_765531 [Mollisia scopiformis]KUJ08066.1 hypothetical protein LY89DRAFT_765531 [Mollisia scopiformis]